MNDRHACACTACPCQATAAEYGNQCPCCARGAHRPSRAIQDHLREGLERWIGMLPVSLGSSGLSDKQLGQAGDAWQAWHDKRPCPVPRQAVA